MLLMKANIKSNGISQYIVDIKYSTDASALNGKGGEAVHWSIFGCPIIIYLWICGIVTFFSGQCYYTIKQRTFKKLI